MVTQLGSTRAAQASNGSSSSRLLCGSRNIKHIELFNLKMAICHFNGSCSSNLCIFMCAVYTCVWGWGCTSTSTLTVGRCRMYNSLFIALRQDLFLHLEEPSDSGLNTLTVLGSQVHITIPSSLCRVYGFHTFTVFTDLKIIFLQLCILHCSLLPGDPVY